MYADNFYDQNSNNLIEKIDQGMLNFYKKIGESWQKKTYTSKDRLKTYFFISAAESFFYTSTVTSIQDLKIALQCGSFFQVLEPYYQKKIIKI